MTVETLLQKTDIKLSVKQTFGFDSDMKVAAFSKRMSTFQRLIQIINLTKIRH